MSTTITLECPVPPEIVDALEDWLCGEPRPGWSLYQRPGDPAFTLTGFFQEQATAAEAFAELQQAFPSLPDAPTLGSIEDRDWQEAYKAFLHPWQVEHLHWVPAWQRESYPVPPGEAAIYLDAGMAFGTGSHETTRLMARRLIEFQQAAPETFAQASIIDAGCGSGILALSAVRLGARHVYAFDHDNEAIRVSLANAQANGLSLEHCRFEVAGIEEGLRGRRPDLLIANIQADILAIHAETLVQSISLGGWLALSGILTSEVDSLEDRFVTLAKSVWRQCQHSVRSDGEWSDLLLIRN